MKCHRIEELLELLEPEWHKDQELNLLQFIVKLAKEAGYEGKLEDLTDDVLIQRVDDFAGRHLGHDQSSSRVT